MRLQPLTLDEACTSLGILDDVGIVKMEGKRDMLKRTVTHCSAARGGGGGTKLGLLWDLLCRAMLKPRTRRSVLAKKKKT